MTVNEYKSMTLAQMSAKRWRTTQAVASWHVTIPEGVEVKLEQKRGDCFTVASLPCECCGVIAKIRKCHRSKVEEFGEVEEKPAFNPDKAQDADTKLIFDVLTLTFNDVYVYRYNAACIRVRVIEPRFYGKSSTQRDNMVEKRLKVLPKDIQAQIVNLLTLYPGEHADNQAKRHRNEEFENPSPSEL